MQRDTNLSLDDIFLPRNLWHRFEDLMVQQMFRLQTDETVTQGSSSLYSFNSGETTRCETMMTVPRIPTTGQLQRNTNALCSNQMGDHPLFGKCSNQMVDHPLFGKCSNQMVDHPLFGKCSNQMVDHPLFGKCSNQMVDHPLFGKCSNQMVDHPLFG
ncbi:hypothetical protein Btru_036173 [Bulinus truncatus]|nr:hypothetical protein Btru_036173 [Bulinus truncatus]